MSFHPFACLFFLAYLLKKHSEELFSWARRSDSLVSYQNTPCPSSLLSIVPSSEKCKESGLKAVCLKYTQHWLKLKSTTGSELTDLISSLLPFLPPRFTIVGIVRRRHENADNSGNNFYCPLVCVCPLFVYLFVCCYIRFPLHAKHFSVHCSLHWSSFGFWQRCFIYLFSATCFSLFSFFSSRRSRSPHRSGRDHSSHRRSRSRHRSRTPRRRSHSSRRRHSEDHHSKTQTKNSRDSKFSSSPRHALVQTFFFSLPTLYVFFLRVNCIRLTILTNV